VLQMGQRRVARPQAVKTDAMRHQAIQRFGDTESKCAKEAAQ